uniref:Fatty-acid amide hydrolase 2 n=1 Tax=Ceratitis capitata TaxID=7213 RepID=W8C047_CERCA
MEITLRLLQFFLKYTYAVVYALLNFFLPRKGPPTIPPIRNPLITLPLVNVIKLMRQRKLKSEDLVKAYIDRIKEVDPHINAVVQDRFDDALADAKRADGLIAKTSDANLPALFNRYTLLGVPFTVKEACGLKGMPFRVGSRKRAHMICMENGEVVGNVVAAGGIPLLISATPEYCFSIETNPAPPQKPCLNPYDSRRASGGSSGGEGALNGAGASLFGVGSDLGGSIRIPSLFCGVFGHKPTGGVTSIVGHFPGSSEENVKQYLQLGPITRYGRDLALLMQVMAGRNAQKLDLLTPVETKDIKIFYSFGFDGPNGILHKSTDLDVQLSILKAVKYLTNHGCKTELTSMKIFENSMEISFGAIAMLKEFPFLINSTNPHKVREHIFELCKSLVGRSEYTKEAIMIDLLRYTNGFMPAVNLAKYKEKKQTLITKLSEMLGNDGVLLLPTFPTPAIHRNTSGLALWNIDYCMLFNIIGFPSTHVPMGLDQNDLPVGFQVVAAPYRDKLCFQIASELEASLNGWIVPTPNDLQPLNESILFL